MKTNTLLTIYSTLLLTAALALPTRAFALETADRPEIPDENIMLLGNAAAYSAGSLTSLDEAGQQEIVDLDLTPIATDELAAQIIDYADNYLGRPYRRGAKGPSAFDCSGFTSYVFKNFDIALSPSSRAQYTQGDKIATEDVQPGDLLFFGGRAGGKTVGHVGMAVDVDDNGRIKFIHASNSKGITYDTYPDGGYYSKRFIGARRVLN